MITTEFNRKTPIKFVIDLNQKIDNSEQYINKSIVSKKINLQ